MVRRSGVHSRLQCPWTTSGLSVHDAYTRKACASVYGGSDRPYCRLLSLEGEREDPGFRGIEEN